MTTEQCHHCQLTGIDEPGAAEFAAHWVDTEGERSDEEYMVCADCLTAGVPEGPGYVRADHVGENT